MVPFFSTGLYSGPMAVALGGADIAMLIGRQCRQPFMFWHTAPWTLRGIDYWPGPPMSASILAEPVDRPGGAGLSEYNQRGLSQKTKSADVFG
jgi:hypothetical protein